MKIAILGAGNMGLSFSKSFLKYDLIAPKNLHLIAKNAEKKEKLYKEYPNSEITTFEETQTIIADLIILAIKPQDFLWVAQNKNFNLAPEQILLSVMAGISIQKIQSLMDHEMVVRAMPNAPTFIGMGITGYTVSANFPFEKLMMIERLLNATGRSVYLEDEPLLNGVTALSGSGPAYFYFIIDAMIKAGVAMGIEENLSRLFVKQTMLGAYHLINNSEKNLETLISEVASKGGTTIAALKSFEENQLKEILIKGILEAERRAKELNE